MSIEGLLGSLITQLMDTIELLPGPNLETKAEILSGILGVVGFIVSVGILLIRLVYRTGGRRLATQVDLNRLGAAVVDGLQERITNQLLATAEERLARADWLTSEQRTTVGTALRRDVGLAVREVSRGAGDEAVAATVDLLNGQTDLAEAFFAERAHDAQPRDAADALHLRAALQSLRDSAEAVRGCRRAVELDPEDPLGWSRLGHLYLRLGRIEEADAAFEKVVELKTKSDDRRGQSRVVDQIIPIDGLLRPPKADGTRDPLAA